MACRTTNSAKFPLAAETGANSLTIVIFINFFQQNFDPTTLSLIVMELGYLEFTGFRKGLTKICEKLVGEEDRQIIKIC
jgi:hypothetical protein